MSQLLGLQSNDIDIALVNMMGLAFAEYFQTYCNSLDGVPIEKIAKVEKNPDRSKHLETAKAKVLDVELDFVNLRSEEYAEDSRIPTQVVSSSVSPLRRSPQIRYAGFWYAAARCAAKRHHHQRTLLQRPHSSG